MATESRSKLDIFPWTDSEDDDMQTRQSDIDMASPTSMTSASTQLPESPASPSIPSMGLGMDERLISETAVASKILWHCVTVINAVREELGGKSLCVFKIGLTSDPFERRASYLQQNVKSFVVLHKVSKAELLGMMEMLEAALIAEFYDNQRCCRNRQLGGESMRRKDFVPRFPPPYYAYCAATCAAQREPILG